MKPSICETKTLIAFLDGTLSEKQEQDLTRHLDACPSCAKELEQMAADARRWNEVKTHLAGPKRTAIAETQQEGDSQTTRAG